MVKNWKIIKRGSKATYGKKKVKIEEVLLDRALICEINGKRVLKKCKIVEVSQLKNITPKPR